MYVEELVTISANHANSIHHYTYHYGNYSLKLDICCL